MPARIVEILLTGNSDQAIKEIEKLVGSTEAASKTMGNSFASLGKYATVAVAAAGVAIAGFSIKAALSFEDAHARMVNAIKNTGGNLDQFAGRIDATQKRLENFGFTNTQVEDSLATLTRVTKDTGSALDLMGLAADIARGRHIDLQSATLLLTKVESGHVALLGRLGINTKDATGATISTTEAIKRLSEMYGGQAKTSAETFGGQLEILKAKSTDLGIQIGQFLLPKLAAMAGFLVDHKEVVIGLAAAIGGVLVTAMTVWIATEAIAAGGLIVDTFILAASAAVSLATSIDLLTVATIAYEVAAVAAFVAPLAAITALVYAVGKLTGTGGSGTFGAVVAELDKGAEAGKKWGASLVANALATQSPLQSLRFELAAVRMEQANAVAAYKAGGMSVEEAANAAGKYGAAIKEVKTQIAATSAEQMKAQAALDATAKALGVTLPDNAKKSAAELKALKTATEALPAVFGELTQKVVDLGLSADELKTFTKQTGDMQTAVSNAMSSSTDAFAHFGTQLDVSEADFQAFFQGSITDSALWAQELQDLMARGVDQGIIAQIARAGPGSKPALDAFKAMVDANGVDVVNSWYQTGENSRQVMVNAIAQMQFDVEQRLVELRNAAANANISVTITANWSQFWSGAPSDSLLGSLKPHFGASGGLVTAAGILHAAGGASVPGTGNTDSVPAMLTPGEYVVPKGGALVMSGGGGSKTIEVTSIVQIDDEALVRAIKKYEIRNGKSWRN